MIGGVFLVLGIRELRYKGYLALLREGIYMNSAISRTLVRWETIERIGPAQIGSQRWLGVRLSRPATINERWLRVLGRTNRPLSGWDVTLPLPLLAGGGALPALVARYARDPEARRELG